MMDMEKKHFSHHHPLLGLERTAELCVGCGSDINGLAFGCKECTFYLHKMCAKLPRELGDPIPFRRDDTFELEFFSLGPGDDYVQCRECCHRIYEQGFVFVAYSYDGQGDREIQGVLHVDCALLRHPYHKYSLVYTKNRKLFSAECGECGVKFHENEYEGLNLYGCDECSDAFHKECLDLPAQVRHQHQHRHPAKLSRYLDPVPWDFNE